MTKYKDDWKKTRSHGQHLTGDEIAKIRRAFFAGRSHRDIARELACSSRVTSKYYGHLRDDGHVMGVPYVAPAPKPLKQVEVSTISPPSMARLMAGR